MNEELGAAAAQAARFASVCKVYAPKYRQMTVAAILAFSAGQDISAPAVLAYTDVLFFLTPRDVDHGGWTPQLTHDGTKAVYSAIVVYAPWIDDAGAGSLRRYTLSHA